MENDSLMVFNGILWDLPSGYVKIAMEKMTIEIVLLPIKDGDSIAVLKYQGVAVLMGMSPYFAYRKRSLEAKACLGPSANCP